MKTILVLTIVMVGWPMQGQAGTQAENGATTTYTPTMTFDVASVRENKANLSQGFTMSGEFTPHTTHLRLMNWDIENILSDAFRVNEEQIESAPKWTFPTLFVIEAKGDAEADAKIAALPADEQRLEQEHMLQSLLADRLKLKAHWETKQSDTYNLVAAKGGVKLGAEGSMPPTADELRLFGDRPIPPIHQKSDGHGYDFIGHGCSIDCLAELLTEVFGRPVANATGLTGRYDFVIAYRGRWDRDRNADDTDPMLPLDRALEKELGLKLEPAKGPVKFLVIDHIEKPTEN